MSARRLAKREDWGQLGPAMRALPNDRWRAFVYHYVTGKPGHGSLARAARLAGFGAKSTPTNVAKLAHNISRDERTVAAIAEEARKIVRVGAPEAATALLNLIRDPEHRDHGRAIAMVLDRADPVETHSRHNIEVVHKVVDPDVEALEELRALRQLGTSREKLLELFGGNGLSRIEKLEAADLARRSEAAKVIEYEPIEAEPEEAEA
jgi:hypothetical protein